MKFFFPDSQDQIDPGFDFGTEEHPALRVRQRDDLYAHEALDGHVIDGLLVSKAIVDGTATSAGKYTAAQRNRLYRVGVRHFFRLDRRMRLPYSDHGRLRCLQLHPGGDPAGYTRIRSSTSTLNADSTWGSRSTTSSSASIRPPTPTRITLKPNSGAPASRSHWPWPTTSW